MDRSRQISEEIVEAAWIEVGSFSQGKATREMQRIMRAQEPLFAFVLECSSDLSQDAHELGYYDFGDDWKHTILVEKILPPDSGLELPVCVKGKRACPPRDCGGPWGYTELLEQLADPDNPEHEKMKQWVGSEWNAEDFDPDQVNQVLRDLTVLPGK